MGRFRARCKLGFDLNTQVHHWGDEPGIVGAAIYGEILIDQRSPRSHPNKAVDVVAANLADNELGFRVINEFLLLTGFCLFAIASVKFYGTWLGPAYTAAAWAVLVSAV